MMNILLNLNNTMCHVSIMLETTSKQARNETFKVHEMEQSY